MTNDVIYVSIFAIISAQLLKYPFMFLKGQKPEFSIIFSTGSMPSSHTALVVAMSLEIGKLTGFYSSIYGLSFVIVVLVIHDALKVRGESGKQAKQINVLSEEIKKLEGVFDFKVSNDFKKDKLKEIIGHTPFEILGGIICGILVFYLYNLR